MSAQKCPRCGAGLSSKYRAPGARHTFMVRRAERRVIGTRAVKAVRKMACPWAPS